MNDENSKRSDGKIDENGADGEETGSLCQQLDSLNADPIELSHKKMQYLEQDIMDKRGVFKYNDDPSTYKKARKRLQNRESAVRSRSRKAEELVELRAEVKVLKEERDE